MTITEIFEIDECSCVEPTIADQTEDGYTAMALGMDADTAELLVDEDEMPIALVLSHSGRWYVSSYVYREADIRIIEKFEQCGGDIFQEKRDDYVRALREYYCMEVIEEFPGVIEDNRPGRDELISELLEEVFGKGCGDAKTAIDFCCGSGVATSVLRDMGKDILSFDIDASLLSLGLVKGRLLPQETMCIDGRDADLFCPLSDICIGLMMGDINNMNSGMWEDMIRVMPSIAKKCLVTVATEPESVKVAGWLEDEGCTVTSYENTRDPIYDRFVIVAE